MNGDISRNIEFLNECDTSYSGVRRSSSFIITLRLEGKEGSYSYYLKEAARYIENLQEDDETKDKNI